MFMDTGEMMGSTFTVSAGPKVQNELMIGTWTGTVTPEQNGRGVPIPGRRNISSIQKAKRESSSRMMVMLSGGSRRMGKEKKEEPGMREKLKAKLKGD